MRNRAKRAGAKSAAIIAESTENKNSTQSRYINAFFNAAKISIKSLDELRKVAVNVGAVAAFVIVVTLGFFEYRRAPEIIIEPFVLPKVLLDLGYTGQMPAYRVADEIEKMTAVTSRPQAFLTSGSSGSSQALATEIGSLKIPETGISIQSLLQSLRLFFGREEIKIIGNFVCGTLPCALDSLFLRLSIKNGDKHRYKKLDAFDPKTIDAYYREAAKQILLEINPHVVAQYLTTSKDSEQEGVNLALRLIAENHPDKIWAHNVIGSYYVDQQNYSVAKFHFDKAIEIDKNFVPAYINIGTIYDALVENCIKDDPEQAKAFAKKSIEHYEYSAKTKDLMFQTRYVSIAINNWARTLSLIGETDQALEKLEEQVSPTGGIDKRYLSRMGYLLNQKKDYKRADYFLTLAKSEEPNNYAILYNAGLVKMALHEYHSAADNFENAAKQRPKIRAVYVRWADALEKDGQSQKATEVMEKAPSMVQEPNSRHRECKAP